MFVKLTKAHKPVDYDHDYDYLTDFWLGEGRQYEERVELEALKKLLPAQGTSLIDLGGGFGRLAKAYLDRFEQVVLLDYSLKNLERAQEELLRKHIKKMTLVAADVYNIPFPNSYFEYALCVRVVHHLQDPLAFFQETRRIVKDGGRFILEYANKRNFKEILRFVFRRPHRSPFTMEPSPVGDRILNYHPRYIEITLENSGFKIQEVLSVSNFRQAFLKSFFGSHKLTLLDSLVQRPLGLMRFGPSIFIRVTALSAGSSQSPDEESPDHGGKRSPFYGSYSVHLPSGSPKMEDKPYWQPPFQCPACLSQNILERENEVRCQSCHRAYAKRGLIYDFRLP
ncbi:class I SAM-dependent methyltransferase [Candidatus Hakubella thermalkaliphila]|uniref:class I SAM-dependent methyltransferase n=1 Tax=Candidatus Hakubella thermalkaliphila TaxID=2754717 RepID=UPI00215918AC|nr:class I SAM-dependent methyltransferase [Candidatus Hakubella thermalkaliphila]